MGKTRRNIAFFFSSRRRHTRSKRDWSSDVCSSDLLHAGDALVPAADHLLRAKAEAEGLAAIDRAVEFLALLAILEQPAGVMDAHFVAGGRGGAVADLAEIGRASCRERVLSVGGAGV